MTPYIGIDGGGTRTRVVVTDAAGRELGRIEDGPGRLRPGDPAASASAVADLIDRALRATGTRPPAESVCVALSGAGRADERLELTAALLREAIALRVRVTTDAEAALHDAFGEGPGLLLVAGTGSIAWGRAADGRGARVGGWGERLGDEGSGYAIGSDALRAILRAHDGRGEPTALIDAILGPLGFDDPETLVTWRAGADTREVAALAPIVLGLAELEHTELEHAELEHTEATGPGGPDAVAVEIVECAADDLAEMISALARRLGPWSDPPALALSGGLLAEGRPLAARVIAALERRGEVVRVLDREVDAARGAAALARLPARP